MVAAALIALDDPAARVPAVAGVKAAGLAEAASAGLPVLPGRILPPGASAAAIAAGVRALARLGPPSAYLSAMESPVSADLDRGLASVTAGHELIVARSTTDRDGDGRWSGTFSSYLGIDAGDLPTAVRGCWASAFSADALHRCEETGVDVRTLRVGVLVQPFLRLDAGGTARVRPDGGVDVSAAPGGPAGVVGGRHGGHDVTVGTDGSIEGEPGRVPATTVRRAAALARRAAGAVAADTIEWGAVGSDIYLLQIGPAAPEGAAGPAPSRPTPVRASIPAGAERIARLVTTFPGPLAEELVLPWAFGAGEVLDRVALGADGTALATGAISVHEPGPVLLEARALAAEQAAAVWGTSPTDAAARASAVSRLLLEGRLEEGLRAVASLRAPDPAAARRVVSIVRGVGELLAGAGVLPSANLIWRLTGPELDRAIAGDRPILRTGPGRWEPFVAEVVRARGEGSPATPVSPGIGAGRPRFLRDRRTIDRPGPREVLVTSLPLPHLAPLLWHSAALVTAAGASGAHLFEVARSLGVPAVIGADIDTLGEPDALVAVDGHTGLVSVLPTAEASGVDVPAGAASPTRATV